MTDIKELDNKEFEKVAGGKTGLRDNFVCYKPGDRKSEPCKYCGAVNSLAFDREDDGWECDFPYFCYVFK